MTSDITITGGDASISTTDQLATADELLGRVRDRIVGNAGTGQIVESLFLKAAIDVASNLPEDGTIVSDAAIERAIRALEKKVSADLGRGGLDGVVVGGAIFCLLPRARR